MNAIVNRALCVGGISIGAGAATAMLLAVAGHGRIAVAEGELP